jgi:hypothetical protein
LYRLVWCHISTFDDEDHAKVRSLVLGSLFIMKYLLERLSLRWLVIGGINFTMGVPFLLWDALQFNHSIWYYHYKFVIDLTIFFKAFVCHDRCILPLSIRFICSIARMQVQCKEQHLSNTTNAMEGKIKNFMIPVQFYSLFMKRF